MASHTAQYVSTEGARKRNSRHMTSPPLDVDASTGKAPTAKALPQKTWAAGNNFAPTEKFWNCLLSLAVERRVRDKAGEEDISPLCWPSSAAGIIPAAMPAALDFGS
jgi:hypothetical protein